MKNRAIKVTARRKESPNRRLNISPPIYGIPSYGHWNPFTDYFPSHISSPPRDTPTPICRCRVLYLGSAVPHITKDRLQGIQEPLKELYPEEGGAEAKGIDSWLSVWSNGFLLENVDENRKKVTRFFPIESLHYCAAVRYVLIPGSVSGPGEKRQKFLPLDSPFARNPSLNHPPLFASILRRTTGIKVLECHVFICKKETAANALVRCAFHAYLDSTCAKHLENGGNSPYSSAGLAPISTSNPGDTTLDENGGMRECQQSIMEISEGSINSIEKVEEWNVLPNDSNLNPNVTLPSLIGTKIASNKAPSLFKNGSVKNFKEIYTDNKDENHKIWTTSYKNDYCKNEGLNDHESTLRSFRSSASGLSHRNKPRQMMMPISPPPPPVIEEIEKEAKKEKRKKHSQRRSKSRDDIDEGMAIGELHRMCSRSHSTSSLLGGVGLNVHQQTSNYKTSSNKSLKGHPIMMSMGTLPPNRKNKAGTFSARDNKISRGFPQHFMMLPSYAQYPPLLPSHLNLPNGHQIYGMSPRRQPQGSSIEHSCFQHQYATIDKSNKYRTNKKSNINYGNKLQSSDSNPDNDSDFATGLNKKNHINEKAFSCSIRNENRSCSYGSLSNDPTGDVSRKQNNDLSNMMADLNLIEDKFEKSEMSADFYNQNAIFAYGPMLQPHSQMIPEPIILGSATSKKKR